METKTGAVTVRKLNQKKGSYVRVDFLNSDARVFRRKNYSVSPFSLFSNRLSLSHTHPRPIRRLTR